MNREVREAVDSDSESRIYIIHNLEEMIYLLLQECIWVISVISLIFIYSFRGIRKTMSAAVTARDSSSPRPSPFSLTGNARSLIPHADAASDAEDGGTVIGETMKRIRVEPASGGLSCHQEIMLLDSLATRRGDPVKPKKRPARLVLPAQRASLPLEFSETGHAKAEEFEARGRGYFMASKKGRRDVMEDGYGVILDILGDPKQAFFTVIDGHGGRAAADYVAENLGKNIIEAIESAKNVEGANTYDLEQAIRRGYSVTDGEFLKKGVIGGACAASVLLKGGELHVANVGDCRVVLSRNGVADTLTSDHRPSKEDERLRIESSGGFVHFRNGVWRVQGSLAISRAIGDIHLKQWIISEPENRKLPNTSDCQFLILASDGLWDKVTGQEAVDVVSREKNLQDSCKKLVEMSSCRGNLDDITVMVVNLRSFAVEAGN